MGVIFELLQGLPLNSVLQEKIAALEAKYGSVETENAILKDDLRKANAEIMKLKQEIESLTHIPDLHETEIEIVKILAEHGRYHSETKLEQILNLPRTRVQFYLGRLANSHKYIDRHSGGCGLNERGMEYAVKNDLT